MSIEEDVVIKLLVVEDSPVSRELLLYIFSKDPELKVIGTAVNGVEAIEFVKHNKPDIITMDINMPKMNGFEATRFIMETDPIPIIIVSASRNTKEVETTFQAVDAGALAVIQRPSGIGHPDFEHLSNELLMTVKAMSEVKVVKRWTKIKTEKLLSTSPEEMNKARRGDFKIVAIGASTGGPVTLKAILSKLPGDFGLPIIIVQHLSEGFVNGFVEWLDQSCELTVKVAENGEQIQPGVVYVAPDKFDLTVIRSDKISLIKCDSGNNLCPSVSSLFKSVADNYGPNSIGILLTGMGRDGAKELKLMKDKGAITFAQDKNSSIIHGMPNEAIKLGGATHILSPEEIIVNLINISQN